MALLYSTLFGRPPASKETTRVYVDQSMYDFTAKFSRLCNVAYCVDAPITPLRTDFSCGESCRYFPNMTLDAVFGGDFYSTSITGYTGTDHHLKEKYIVFRGTFSIPDIVTDIQFQRSPWLVQLPPIVTTKYNDFKPAARANCTDCQIHDGFAKAFNETLQNAGPQINDFLSNNTDYKLYVAGHSLGAAQAQLFATSFKLQGYDPILVSYGQPRIGNKEFADFVSELFFDGDDGLSMNDTRRMYRFTHWNDIFVGLPDWGNYTHSVGEIYIDQRDVYPPLNAVTACAGPENPDCHRGTFNLWEQINLFQNHLAYIYYIGYCALNIGKRDVFNMPKYTGNYTYGHRSEYQTNLP